MKTTTPPKKVVDCYSFLDAFASSGVTDYTDGKYNNDPTVSYEQAQVNQAEYLLDQIQCGPGSKILDIGCGNGRILGSAEKRGAIAIGITISPEQVKKNNVRGLKTILMNYKDIPAEYNDYFDGIIANGSIEHFVQLKNVVEGKQNEIYKHMFSIMHRILKPGGRAATTVIHLRLPIDPYEIQKGVDAFPRGSAQYHMARLVHDFGGWYPTGFQLIESAKAFFKHIRREDGTQDYHQTSEDWLKMWKKAMWAHSELLFVFLKKFIKNPKDTFGFIDDLLISQSWATQFRDWHGQGTPTYLFRDTWEKV